jgi:hypothetical protein
LLQRCLTRAAGVLFCSVLKVAVLIPFRNRHEHLPIFFLHLIPMLQKQRLEFAFYVIEQVRTVSKWQ